MQESTVEMKYTHTSEWETKNPILKMGELGLETDTGLFKIGDGKTPWDELRYENSNLLLTEIGRILI